MDTIPVSSHATDSADLQLTKPIAAVILGAGKGTRMKSDMPKVMHKLAGRELLGHVIASVEDLAADQIVVVVGPGMPEVAKVAQPHRTVEQTDRLGTAHAALMAQDHLKDFHGTLMVLFGDTPLVSFEALAGLASAAERADLAIAAFEPEDPAKYGRVVLDEAGQLEAIVEFKDASLEEREIMLCNGGIMAGDCQKMLKWLNKVDNKNKAGEYYLPDVVKFAVEDQAPTEVVLFDETDVLGINSRIELANAETILQDMLRDAAMAEGVTMIDPGNTYLSWDSEFGQDVIIEPGCFFGPGVKVGSGTTIKAMSHLEGCEIGKNCDVGPFARLRPGTKLGSKAKIGNFVETKKASIADGAKVNHLSYVGDATVGAKANIGAGTITCNYDGYDKYQTVIGAEAFIGSNSALVAPVTIGEGALIGAGSTVTKDVPDHAVGVVRAEQRNIAGAEKRRREKKLKAKGA